MSRKSKEEKKEGFSKWLLTYFRDIQKDMVRRVNDVIQSRFSIYFSFEEEKKRRRRSKRKKNI